MCVKSTSNITDLSIFVVHTRVYFESHIPWISVIVNSKIYMRGSHFVMDMKSVVLEAGIKGTDK